MQFSDHCQPHHDHYNVSADGAKGWGAVTAGSQRPGADRQVSNRMDR